MTVALGTARLMSESDGTATLPMPSAKLKEPSPWSPLSLHRPTSYHQWTDSLSSSRKRTFCRKALPEWTPAVMPWTTSLSTVAAPMPMSWIRSEPIVPAPTSTWEMSIERSALSVRPTTACGGVMASVGPEPGGAMFTSP